MSVVAGNSFFGGSYLLGHFSEQPNIASLPSKQVPMSRTPLCIEIPCANSHGATFHCGNVSAVFGQP